MPSFVTAPRAVAGTILVVIGGTFVVAMPALTFKPDLLGTVVPTLIGGVLAIAAITERAVAVLNDIWFGGQRHRVEDDIRRTNRTLDVMRDNAGTAQTLAREAIRSGKGDMLAQATAFEALVVPDKEIRAFSETLSQSEAALATVDEKRSQTRLAFAFIVGILVSIVGVRTLGVLFETASLAGLQKSLFEILDIILTAGVLAGGTSGINAISDLLGTYASVSRKRALERT